jgi:hypothetical protein
VALPLAVQGGGWSLFKTSINNTVSRPIYAKSEITNFAKKWEYGFITLVVGVGLLPLNQRMG